MKEFSTRTSGAKTIVTWSKLRNRDLGAPFEVTIDGPALVTIDGNFAETDSLLVKGSNNGEDFHLIAGKFQPGALPINAVPAFIRPELYGRATSEVTVSVTFTTKA